MSEYQPDIDYIQVYLSSQGISNRVVPFNRNYSFSTIESYGSGPIELGCIDDRHSNLVGIPGGLSGVVSMLKISYEEAIQRARRVNFDPLVHGDEKHPILGCGYHSGWLAGKIRGLFSFHESYPDLGNDLPHEEHLLSLFRAIGIKHSILKGAHTAPIGILNTVKDSSVKRNGKAFVYDDWALDKFGVEPDHRLYVFSQTMRLLLPDPEVLIVAK